MLSGIMFYWRKTRPETHSTTFNENSFYENENCFLSEYEIVAMKNFEL